MRVLDRLDELYAIGDRIGYSPEEDRAHALARGWMEQAGLDVSVDDAGNLIGRHPAGGDAWTGSHLDTVPNGGRFDGALGVVAGIAAVEAAGRGVAVVFRDEERGCNGSRAFAGRPGAYVELHIEQGPVLAEAGAPLGVVRSIAGVARGDLVVQGRLGHAGTVPMATRDDALVKAAELVLRIRDTARGIEGAVATVGRLAVEPGFANVIPARAVVSVDARAPDLERFERLLSELELEPAYRVEPVAMSERVRSVLGDEVERLGLPVVELPSGAGHDAGILASRGIPAGMLFVRSLNGGVSHSPDELSSAEDIALAVEVLTAAVTSL